MTFKILFSGDILATIWLFLCIMMEGKKRTCVIVAGFIADIVLLIIYKKYKMFAIGALSGLVYGLISVLERTHKFKLAVSEMEGLGKLLIVIVIFSVMIYMVMVIAYPNFIIDLW